MMQEPNKKESNPPKLLIINLKGSLDTTSSIDFFEYVNAKLIEGHSRFIINCENLNYISSAGISVILRIKKRIMEKKAILVYSSLNKEIRLLFNFFGLDRQILTAEDREQAKSIIESVRKNTSLQSEEPSNVLSPKVTLSRPRLELDNEVHIIITEPLMDAFSNEVVNPLELEELTDPLNTSDPKKEAIFLETNPFLVEENPRITPDSSLSSFTEEPVSSIEEIHEPPLFADISLPVSNSMKELGSNIEEPVSLVETIAEEPPLFSTLPENSFDSSNEVILTGSEVDFDGESFWDTEVDMDRELEMSDEEIHERVQAALFAYQVSEGIADIDESYISDDSEYKWMNEDINEFMDEFIELAEEEIQEKIKDLQFIQQPYNESIVEPAYETVYYSESLDVEDTEESDDVLDAEEIHEEETDTIFIREGNEIILDFDQLEEKPKEEVRKITDPSIQAINENLNKGIIDVDQIGNQ
jgi:anti-anti-sigma factor